MSVKRSSLASSQNAVPVGPIDPLGLAELAYVRDALGDFAPDWSVDLHGICVHEATLVLLPEAGDDAFGPSFVISVESLGYRVDQVRWDVAQEVGIYPTLADVLAAVRVRLAFHVCLTETPSLTVH